MDTTIVNPRECIVCQLEFSEPNRRPRNLDCAHHLCEQCIEQLIIKNPFCPLCHHYICGKSSTDFKINFGVEDFMQFTSRAVTQAEDTSMTARMTNLTTEFVEVSQLLISECQERTRILKERIHQTLSLKNGLKKGVERLETEIQAKIDEVIAENRTAMSDLEKEAKNLIDVMEIVETKDKNLMLVSEALGKAETSMSAAICLGKADLCHSEVEQWLAFNDLPPEQDDVVEKASKICAETEEKCNLMLEVLCSKKPTIGPTLYRKGLLPEVLKAETLEWMTDELRELITEGSLYAVQRVKGQIFSARFSVRENELYLHNLENKSPPKDARTIAYKEVISLTDKSNYIVFLEMGSKEDLFERIHIRLLSNNPRTKNFIFLCSGAKEASFVNSRVLEVWGKGQPREHLKMGDYERNTGEGGAAVVPIPAQITKKNSPWTAGAVWGKGLEATASQFCINTTDDPNEEMEGVFGWVERGLEVLKDAIRTYSDIRKLKIVACGIVLPYATKKG